MVNKWRFDRLISMNLSVSESKYCCAWNPGGLDFFIPCKIRQKLTIRVESDLFSSFFSILFAWIISVAFPGGFLCVIGFQKAKMIAI